MSLKDEIEKLIMKEQERLREVDKLVEENDPHYWEEQQNRLKPLTKILAELVVAIEPEFVSSITNIEDLSEHKVLQTLGGAYPNAAIELNYEYESSAKWDIEPNSVVSEKPMDAKLKEARDELNLTGPIYESSPGFKIIEEIAKNNHDGSDRNTYEFETVEEVVEYLSGAIAKQVAFYRHKRK